MHDRCETFPTYMRTYEMLQANELLSQFVLEQCNHQTAATTIKTEGNSAGNKKREIMIGENRPWKWERKRVTELQRKWEY